MFLKNISNFISHALDFSTSSKKYLDKLESKRFIIGCTDLSCYFLLQFIENRIQLELCKHADEIPVHHTDSQLQGPSVALMNFLLYKNRVQATQLGLTVTGDLEASKHLEDLVKNLYIDWEELLSHWIGDVAAHQVGIFLKKTKLFSSHILQSFTRNFQEYLQEEKNLLPTKYETQHFIEDVDTLRFDVERLEKRVLFMTQQSTEFPPNN